MSFKFYRELGKEITDDWGSKSPDIKTMESSDRIVCILSALVHEVSELRIDLFDLERRDNRRNMASLRKSFNAKARLNQQNIERRRQWVRPYIEKQRRAIEKQFGKKSAVPQVVKYVLNRLNSFLFGRNTSISNFDVFTRNFKGAPKSWNVTILDGIGQVKAGQWRKAMEAIGETESSRE